MAIGSKTAIELARTGVNLHVRNGVGSSTVKELVSIAVSQNRRIIVSTSGIGPTTAKEIAAIGGDLLTLVIEKDDD